MKQVHNPVNICISNNAYQIISESTEVNQHFKNKCYLLLHLISYYQFISRKASASFISLSRNYLYCLLGKNYKQIINFLSQKEILIIKKGKSGKETYVAKNFVNGNNSLIAQSKQYKILKPFNSKKINLQIFDDRLCKKLEQIKHKKEVEILNSQYSNLYRHLKSVSLHPSTKDKVQELYDNKEITKQQFKKYNQQINSINSGNFYFEYQNRVNRLFTNISNLSKKLKPYLQNSYNDELIEIDIVNSQPFLLNLILPSKLKQTYKTEFDDYLNLTTNPAKDFYSEIGKELNLERESIKKLFLQLFFSENDIRGYNKLNLIRLRKYFMNNYFYLYQYIRTFRGIKLAHILQQTESNLVIEKIAIPLAFSLFILTIHDSIICKKTDKDIVLNHIHSVFSGYGITPKLRIKSFQQT